MSTRIEINKKIAVINSASSAVTLLLNVSVLVWLQQYLLKRISAEEYSLLPLVMSLMAFAPLFTTFLTSGLSRFLTVACAKGDDDEVTAICSTMFPILSAVALLMLAGGLVLSWHIDKILVIAPERLWDARIMLGLLVASTAVRLPASAFGSGFMVRQKLMWEDMITVTCQLVRFALLFILLFGVSTRVLWVVTASVSSDMLALAIKLPFSIRLLPAQRVRFRTIRWHLARDITGYGSWSLVNEVANMIKIALDPIVLNRFATAVDVSAFHVGGIAPRQLRMLAAPLGRPMIPVFTALYATGDKVRMRNTYFRMCRYRTWPIALVGVPAMVFSSEFIHLYVGDKYSAAAGVMTALILARLLIDLNAPTYIIAGACGEVKEFSLRQFAIHSVNLALTILFVVAFGMGAVGSAAATLGAVVLLEPLLMWRLGWRITGATPASWWREAAWPCVLPMIVSATVCYALKLGFNADTWLRLLGFSAAGAVAFALVAGRWSLREQDRLDLCRLLDRIPGERVRALARRVLGLFCRL